ncbi:diphthine--ammonia ligase [Brevibacillus sp. SYP-B805]|uniref:Dph6-related ATP pyrophosphatase n=1 Tax=Brevibacillus sp. SYP-B805 TaxID=1578199 RepID=UPI0013EC6C14|nr:diphthine--ammonia ligase [Brevibacillus sp. SYP-B805]NGQ96531.1 diphthine--ammonia ligase [Brevibacillus sp. SYP-B805]
MRTALSWSGGKDGCMALHKLVQEGVEVVCLLTTVPAETGRTFGHGERVELIRAQAEALSIPIHFVACSYEDYTDAFVRSLRDLKERYQLDAIAYGDLYLDEHRAWGTTVAESVGLAPLYPLWMNKDDAAKALQAFVDSGYRAVVIRVRDDKLTPAWLGREVDQAFLQEIVQQEVCPMGEAGEYHTFVYDGPLFQQKVVLAWGDVIQLDTTKRIEVKNFGLAPKR